MQIQMNIVMYASHLKKTGRMVSRFSCYLCAVSGGRPWRFLRAVKYQGSSRARKKPSLCRCCEWNKWKWMLHGSASACHDVLSLLFLPQQISFLDHFTLKPHFQNHCTWDIHKKKINIPWSHGFPWQSTAQTRNPGVIILTKVKTLREDDHKKYNEKTYCKQAA